VRDQQPGGDPCKATRRYRSAAAGEGSACEPGANVGLNTSEQQLAVAGQNRSLAWLSTNANGDRFGVTISEFGEVGGPGFGGCPATGSIAIPIH
jgi:hypothetical protein